MEWWGSIFKTLDRKSQRNASGSLRRRPPRPWSKLWSRNSVPTWKCCTWPPTPSTRSTQTVVLNSRINPFIQLLLMLIKNANQEWIEIPLFFHVLDSFRPFPRSINSENVVFWLKKPWISIKINRYFLISSRFQTFRRSNIEENGENVENLKIFHWILSKSRRNRWVNWRYLTFSPFSLEKMVKMSCFDWGNREFPSKSIDISLFLQGFILFDVQIPGKCHKYPWETLKLAKLSKIYNHFLCF